jgi:hypothetical protein
VYHQTLAAAHYQNLLRLRLVLVAVLRVPEIVPKSAV